MFQYWFYQTNYLNFLLIMLKKHEKMFLFHPNVKKCKQMILKLHAIIVWILEHCSFRKINKIINYQNNNKKILYLS